MVNANKLKGRIVEQGRSIEDLAGLIGMHRSTLYRKIAGDFPFTVDEAGQIVTLLDLSNEDAISIFFSQGVPETRHGKGENHARTENG